MSLYASILKQFGLKKESARGTAEAAPTAWFPCEKSTGFKVDQKLLADKGLRGVAAEFPAIAGPRDVSGQFKSAFDTQMAGEFLYSVLGGISSSQQGGTAAYMHTFTQGTGIQKQSYTFFVDEVVSVKKYNLGVVKKFDLTCPPDGLIEMSADIIAADEASGSIGSPTYPTQKYLSTPSASVKIATVADTNIKNWSLSIDNGAKGLRVVNGSPLISDVVTPGIPTVKGSFVIYFASETERAKFLAATTSAIEFIMTGTQISGSYYHALDVVVPKIQYTAYPFGDDSELVAANVSWEAKYDTSTSKLVSAALTNINTAY